MQASYFGMMSYGPTRERSTSWPVPNELFEADRALKARDNFLDECQLADELNFDWVSCAEHHYSPGSLAPNLHMLGVAMCQRVKHAKIGILGSLLPLNNPVRIAEELAMLDLLSDGRLVVALLRGAPYEYLVYNVNPAESHARFREGWDLVLKAWTETRPFGWEGEYYNFRNVSIWPRPIQQPTPPVFVSGSSKDSGEFAAKKRVGLGLAFTNRMLATEASKFYRERAAELGWQPTPSQIIYRLGICVDETDDNAFSAVREGFERGAEVGNGILNANRLVASSNFFGKRDERLTERFQNFAAEGPRTLEAAIEMGTILCGSPRTIVNQIKRLRDEIGCGVLDLAFQAPGGSREAKLRSLELFGKKVLPEIRDL
jgi:alkanesulfonate monooxygenase SsuD/methylene tetrahydromethanopterin reductase-like flavin-dependent oxidoreductase (luciferase family)